MIPAIRCNPTENVCDSKIMKMSYSTIELIEHKEDCRDFARQS